MDKIRTKYNAQLASMAKRVVAEATKVGGLENISDDFAQACHKERRSIGSLLKEETAKVSKIAAFVVKVRNIVIHGDSLGPTFYTLKSQGRSNADMAVSAACSGGGDLGLKSTQDMNDPSIKELKSMHASIRQSYNPVLSMDTAIKSYNDHISKLAERVITKAVENGGLGSIQEQFAREIYQARRDLGDQPHSDLSNFKKARLFINRTINLIRYGDSFGANFEQLQSQGKTNGEIAAHLCINQGNNSLFTKDVNNDKLAQLEDLIKDYKRPRSTSTTSLLSTIVGNLDRSIAVSGDSRELQDSQDRGAGTGLRQGLTGQHADQQRSVLAKNMIERLQINEARVSDNSTLPTLKPGVIGRARRDNTTSR